MMDSIRTLRRRCAPFVRPAVALSGGVDSSFLLWFLAVEMKRPVVAFTAVTPFMVPGDAEDAQSVAKGLAVPWIQVSVDPLVHPLVRLNAEGRCYWCKRMMMRALKGAAARRGCDAVLDGSQVDDLGQDRPGWKALVELGISSPLVESGVDKKTVRKICRQRGLPWWNRPSQSCLATRIPHGRILSRRVLQRVAEVESLVLARGARKVRARFTSGGIELWLDRASLDAFRREAIFPRLRQELESRGLGRISLSTKPYG